ncbi:GIY-YIG nuclease family protein [Daejeonella oryzae]|uniref:GIY-YIG nuclease family protein n=1 Tax=Daejeonella oryzae TaxID=1122943 RepID=UPI00047EC74C|nr:GIY-YIG nuclease family protein [Daejeonella oryzae]
MFFTYVAKSLIREFYYKGHCANLELRLQEHNEGKTKSNKCYAPFKIVYFEEFNTRLEAIDREKYFKTSAGRKFIKAKITMVP